MNFLTRNAHWLLRMAFASVFVYHGVFKFADLEGLVVTGDRSLGTSRVTAGRPVLPTPGELR
jgi:uncharacterized membrane protein YphA (DoxX/SURF4 family)